MDGPYRAVYGRIPARQLADWSRRHGATLVERKLRRFKGSTDVYEGLSITLREQAPHFFYFNNGVTLLCNSCAQVLVTIVSLEQAPLGFGALVTQNRNRQNAVDIRDFAALDERQRHWHDTLDLVGVNYICQVGNDDPPHGPTVFDVAEAARALACSSAGRDWAEDVVAAAADAKRPFRPHPPPGAAAGTPSPYKRTFPDTLQAKELWRAVQVARLVSDAMLARARTEADPAGWAAGCLRAADTLREGRWLALHLLFVKTGLRRGGTLALTAAEAERTSRGLDRIAELLVAAAQAQPWGKQAAALFQNRNDCETLKAVVMRTLAEEAL
jgi:hypothetical protein